jgi:hypothetical protein
VPASNVPEPEYRTYQAELSDPECPDRMEVFGADDDEDALRQAYEFCEGEVLLLELFELDEDYNTIRPVPITPRADRLAIEIPLAGFGPDAIDRLCKMVAAKEPLIKKALAAEELPIQVLDDRISFPWFKMGTAEQTDAYAHFITTLCKTAIAKKRVTAKVQEACDNERFSMRVWLIGLGLVGPEFSLTRKLMMNGLSGNSSFRTQAGADAWQKKHGSGARDTITVAPIPGEEVADDGISE